MAKRSRRPAPKLLRSRYRGKRVCKSRPDGTTLCAIGGKTGFAVWLYPIGSRGQGALRLPVSTNTGRGIDRNKTAREALQAGEAFVRRVRRGQ